MRYRRRVMTSAARRPNFVVIRTTRLAQEDDVFLADLERDPGERDNLRDAHPELVAELRARRRTAGARAS